MRFGKGPEKIKHREQPGLITQPGDNRPKVKLEWNFWYPIVCIAAYDMLATILAAYVEQIITKGIGEDMVKRAARLIDTSEYKRRQAPPGVKDNTQDFWPG
jgi:hypothetical protein